MEKAQVIKELKALKEAFEEERDAYPICLEEAIRLLEQPNGGDMISRKAAIKLIREGADAAHSMHDWDMEQGYLNAIECIEEEPSAQPEIIHCQNCKHWREGDAYSYCQKLFNCGVLDVYDYMRAEDDFCSLAERREE